MYNRCKTLCTVTSLTGREAQSALFVVRLPLFDSTDELQIRQVDILLKSKLRLAMGQLQLVGTGTVNRYRIVHVGVAYLP